MTSIKQRTLRKPLTAEIANPRSPVRQFLNRRFSTGSREVQRRFREGIPALAVPGLPRTDANPGTVGTAADWLLRFLLHPQPDLHLAMAGAAICEHAGVRTIQALAEIATVLGVPLPEAPRTGTLLFQGPSAGSTAPPEELHRACWVLALLTEAFRGGLMVVANGPLSQFRSGKVTGAELLGIVPPPGLDQLAKFHDVFDTALIPELATRRGLWALGPTFDGSALINADADLIAARLLLDLKTSMKPALPLTDLLQIIGYALLDFGDEFAIDTLGVFSARYSYLATWGLAALLEELAGHPINISDIRQEFRDVLTNQTLPGPGRQESTNSPDHSSMADLRTARLIRARHQARHDSQQQDASFSLAGARPAAQQLRLGGGAHCHHRKSPAENHAAVPSSHTLCRRTRPICPKLLGASGRVQASKPESYRREGPHD